MEGLEVKDAIIPGVLGGAYAIYKFWQTIKQDNKGDTVDSRIDSFTKTLQAQLDKAIIRIDSLQQERTGLVAENALVKAKLAIAEAEIVRLREGFDPDTFKRAAQHFDKPTG